MSKLIQSRISDDSAHVSPKGDMHQPLLEVLRESRLNRHLTQEALARKLGVRQRQISDLERSTIDPRLSTIQNVARALDLELMLIPRQLISAVDSLHHARAAGNRPMYALGPGDEDLEPGDEPRVEVGADAGPRNAAARRRRRRTVRR